jgi:hypothetical protein
MAVHDALSPTLRTRSSSQELRRGHDSTSSFHRSSSSSSNSQRTSAQDYKQQQQPPRFLSGLEVLIEDLILGYLTFLHIVIIVERHVRGFLRTMWGLMSSWSDALHLDEMFEEPIDRTYMMEDSNPTTDGSSIYYEPDSTAIMSEDSNTTVDQTTVFELQQNHEHNPANDDAVKDEWGHFADFQDELADESSFIPSCRVKLNPDGRKSSITATTLQTLTEIAEDDDDGDDNEEEWSF